MINYAMRRCLMPRSAAAPPPDLLTGLRWFYDLDEASGKALADYGSGGDWTNNGSVGQSTGPGGIGNSRSFNGSSQYFTSGGAGVISYFTLPSTGPLTISIYFYPTTFSGYQDAFAVGTSWTNSINLAWGFRLVDTTGVPRFSYNDGGTVKFLDWGSGVSLSAWHHALIAADDAGNLALSIDGGTAVTTTYGSFLRHAALNTLYVGANQTYFTGRLARFGMWDRYIEPGSAEAIALATYPYTYAELT